MSGLNIVWTSLFPLYILRLEVLLPGGAQVVICPLQSQIFNIRFIYVMICSVAQSFVLYEK